MSFSTGVSADDSGVQVPPSEPQKGSEYVKKKIKNAKKGEPLARARKEHWPTSLAKVIKKAISISELLTEQDQADNVRVLREAKAATHRIFDPATKQLIEVPDHKTRLAAITLELAYTEGRPVERQLTVNASSDDFAAMVEKYAKLLGEDSSQKTVQEPASDEGEGAN